MPGGWPRFRRESGRRGATAAAGLVLVAATLGNIGCRSGQLLRESREYTDGYFTAFREEPAESLLEFYAPAFLDATGGEEWLDSLREARRRSGPLESFVSEKWSMEVMPNGTFVTFDYDVRYSREDTVETVTVVRPVNEERWMVFGHHVRSRIARWDEGS